MREYECGEQFCHACGDCMACYGSEPCYVQDEDGDEAHYYIEDDDA